MEVTATLAWLKYLVNHNQFQIVRRKNQMAMPVPKRMVKMVVGNLTRANFVKRAPNRNHPGQVVWIFKLGNHYIKFVLVDAVAIFISFHLDY